MGAILVNVLLYLSVYAIFIIGVSTIIRAVSDYRIRRIFSKGNSIRGDTQFGRMEDLEFEEDAFILEYYNLAWDSVLNARKLILVFSLIVALMNIQKGIGLDVRTQAMILVAYIYTAPKRKILGVPTITGILINNLRLRFSRDVDAEIHSLISWVRNISLTENISLNNPIVFLEKLEDNAEGLKGVIQVVLNRWQLGDIDGGADYFNRRVDTPYGDRFANLLRNINRMELEEFTQQLTAMQSIYREEQFSEMQSSFEKSSVKLYIPAVISSFLILVNFIYITMYLSSMEALKMF